MDVKLKTFLGVLNIIEFYDTKIELQHTLNKITHFEVVTWPSADIRRSIHVNHWDQFDRKTLITLPNYPIPT